MERISRTVGRCLTETKRSDFDAVVTRFAEFVRIGQDSRQPKHVSEISGPLSDKSFIGSGNILYGVEQDGTLTWLGQVIDSSD